MALIGFDDAVAASINGLCGTLGRFEDAEGWRDAMSLSETDLVIGPGGIQVPMSTHVVRWGDHIADSAAGVSTRHGNAVELTVPGDAPEEFRLAIEQLVAALQLMVTPQSGLYNQSAKWIPLLATTDAPVAAIYRRANRYALGSVVSHAGYGFAVPAAADLPLWLVAVLGFLHQHDSEAVPNPPPRVATSEDWHTPAEAEISSRIVEIDRRCTEMGQQRSVAGTQLTALNAATDTAERAVLWSMGDDLTEAVKRLLVDVGFVVTDADAQVTDGKPRHEDLRVSPPDDPSIVVLVEVKGYQKGAKTNDLQQINKHVKNFLKTTGAEPQAVWWIFNDHRLADPSLRPKPLQGSEDQPGMFDVVAIANP